jgi:hypothetical protein
VALAVWSPVMDAVTVSVALTEREPAVLRFRQLFVKILPTSNRRPLETLQDALPQDPPATIPVGKMTTDDPRSPMIFGQSGSP